MSIVSSPGEIARTPRTTLRRRPQRGSYARTDIHRIIDEALICHVGFVAEGQPYVLPTVHARVGDRLYIHGSAASRMLGTLASGVEMCVTMSLIDGVILARSAFHHSVNYRSVVVLGRATPVVDLEEKLAALRAVVEHVVPDRWRHVRGPTPQELKATLVLALPVTEGSAKIRSGPPLDDEADYALPVWAGEIPLRLVAFAPVADPRLDSGVALPAHVRDYPNRLAPAARNANAAQEEEPHVRAERVS